MEKYSWIGKIMESEEVPSVQLNVGEADFLNENNEINAININIESMWKVFISW